MSYPQVWFILIMAFLSLLLLAIQPYGTQPVPDWLDDEYPVYRIDKYTGFNEGGQWWIFRDTDGRRLVVIPNPFYMGSEE